MELKYNLHTSFFDITDISPFRLKTCDTISKIRFLHLKNIALRSILKALSAQTLLNPMAIRNHPSASSDNWFNRGTPAPFEINRRMSVRYVRNDIGVTIRKIGLFNFTFLANKDISVKLIDISSRGALVATNMRLATNKNIFLTLRFADFKEFEIPGKVVRKAVGDLQIYGIKFDQLNEEMADHLLATQRKLAFK